MASNLYYALHHPSSSTCKKNVKTWYYCTLQDTKYQKYIDLIIPKAPFSHLVREIMHDFICNLSKQVYRARRKDCAITCCSIQELLATLCAVEEYLVGLLHDGIHATVDAKHLTLTNRDLQLVFRFQNNCYAFNLDPNMP